MKEVKFDSYVDAEKFLDEVPRFTKKNPLEDTKDFMSTYKRWITEFMQKKILVKLFT